MLTTWGVGRDAWDDVAVAPEIPIEVVAKTSCEAG